MPSLLVISHPEVVVDPTVPITEWPLNDTGRRRAAAFARSETFSMVTRLWASTERKAIETAEILAAPRSLPLQQESSLGENDRSATGFLPSQEFEAAADAFFAHPETSFRGWERAADAQARIVSSVRKIIKSYSSGDVAIITHGGVGTLLWCSLNGLPISRRHDQPGQGHYWRADLSELRPIHGWRSIG